MIKLPSTWIQQLPYFRMKVPAKVRVVFRQIKQFGVKFHFPPYRSPHWPPNNGFQNFVPKSLVSKQNCSAILTGFESCRPLDPNTMKVQKKRIEDNYNTTSNNNSSSCNSNNNKENTFSRKNN